MTFSEIGKEVKVKFPEYRDWSDYEAGKAYVERYLPDKLHEYVDDKPMSLQVSDVNAIATAIFTGHTSQLSPYHQSLIDKTKLRDTKPGFWQVMFGDWMLDSRIRHYQAETTEINVLTDQLHAQINAITKQHELNHLPIHLQRMDEQSAVMHEAQMHITLQSAVTAKLAVMVAQKAQMAGLTLELYCKKLDNDLALERLKAEKQIEREHERKQAIDYEQTLTEASLADRQKEKVLRAEHLQSLQEEYQLEISDTPEPLKTRLLKAKRRELRSLEERINEFARRTGKANSRPRTEQPPESPQPQSDD